MGEMNEQSTMLMNVRDLRHGNDLKCSLVQVIYTEILL